MTTATFDSAEAIIKFSSGIELNWDIFTIPIPEHIVVYSTDQKKFKVGDGYHLYQELEDGPSIAGIIANLNNPEDDIFTHLLLTDNNNIIIPNNGVFIAGNLSLTDLQSRLNLVNSRVTLRDANMDILGQRLVIIDNSIAVGDNNKLTIVNNHKLAPGVLPSTLSPSKASPINIVSIKAYSDKTCKVPTARFAYNSTYYIKVEAVHDTVDIVLISYMLVDDNLFTTVTSLGNGIFRIDVKETPADGLLNFTATVTHNTDTATDHLLIPLLGYVDPATTVVGIGVYSDITCKLPVSNLNADTTYYAKVNIDSIVDVINVAFTLTESSGLIHISNLGSGKFKLDVDEPMNSRISTLTGTATYGSLISTLSTIISLRAYIPALHISNIGIFTDSDCTTTTTQFNADNVYYAKIDATYGNLTIDKLKFTLTSTNSYVTIVKVNNNIFKVIIGEPPINDTITLNGSIAYLSALVSGAISVSLRPLIAPIIISGVSVYSDLACTVAVSLMNPNTTYYAKIIASYGNADISKIVFSMTSNNTHAVVAANLGLGIFKINVGSSTVAADITFNGTAQYTDSSSSGTNYTDNIILSNLPLNTNVTLVGKGGPRTTFNSSTNYTTSTSLNNLPLNTTINVTGKGGPRTVASSGTNYVFPATYNGDYVPIQFSASVPGASGSHWVGWEFLPYDENSIPALYSLTNTTALVREYQTYGSWFGYSIDPFAATVTNFSINGNIVTGQIVNYAGAVIATLSWTLTAQPYTNYNAGTSATETINGTTYTFPGQAADGSSWNPTSFNISSGSNPNSVLTIPAGGNLQVSYGTFNVTYTTDIVVSNLPLNTDVTMAGRGGPRTVASSGTNYSFPANYNGPNGIIIGTLPYAAPDADGIPQFSTKNAYLTFVPQISGLNDVNIGISIVEEPGYDVWLVPQPYVTNLRISNNQVIGDVYTGWYDTSISNQLTLEHFGTIAWDLTAHPYSTYNAGAAATETINGVTYTFPGQAADGTWNVTTLTANTGSNPNSTIAIPAGGSIKVSDSRYYDGLPATGIVNGTPHTFPGQLANGAWNTVTVNTNTGTNPNSTLTIPVGGNINVSYTPHNVNYTANASLTDLPTNTDVTMVGKGGPRNTLSSNTNYTSNTTLNNLPANTTINMVGKGGPRVISDYGTNWVWPGNYNGDHVPVWLDNWQYYPDTFPQIWSLNNFQLTTHSYAMWGSGDDQPQYTQFQDQTTTYVGWLSINGNIVTGHLLINGYSVYDLGAVSWTLTAQQYPIYADGPAATETISGIPYTFPGQHADGTYNSTTISVDTNTTNAGSTLTIPVGGNIQLSYGASNANYTTSTIVRDLPLNTNIVMTGKGGPRSVSGRVANWTFPASYAGASITGTWIWVWDSDGNHHEDPYPIGVTSYPATISSLGNVSVGLVPVGTGNPAYTDQMVKDGYVTNLRIVGSQVIGDVYASVTIAEAYWEVHNIGTMSWNLTDQGYDTYSAGIPATEIINGTTYSFPGQSADGSTWNTKTFNVSISYDPNSALVIPAGGNINVSYTYHTPGTSAYETLNGIQYTFPGQAADGTWNTTSISQNTGSNTNSVLTIPTGGNINVSYIPYVVSTITGYATIHMLQYIPPVAHYNMITSVYAGANTGDTNFHSFQYQAVTIDHVGNIIAVGNCSAPINGATKQIDPVVVKYDSNLNVISKKIYTASDNFSFNSVCVDSNNNIYCVGGCVSVDGDIAQPTARSLVVKFDSSLNFVSGWIYNTTSNFCSIVYHSSNCLFILGSGYLIKMSIDLATIVDANLINKSYIGLAIDPAGYLYCYGCTTYKNLSSSSFSWQFGSLIEKRDSNLNIIKSIELGVNGHNCIMITDMAFDQNNNIICSGFNGNSVNSTNDTDVTNSTYGTKYDTYQDVCMTVIKLDNSLNVANYIVYKYAEEYLTTGYGNLKVCVDAANNISAFGMGSVVQGLVKFDNSLNILISKRYGINDTWIANATDITSDASNNMYCVGWHTTNEEIAWTGAYDTTISKLPTVLPSGTFASQNVGITVIDLDYSVIMSYTISVAAYNDILHPSGPGTGNDSFRTNRNGSTTTLGAWVDFTFVPTLESTQLV